MKKTELKWPIATVREDGLKAIWLTHTNWMAMKDGIVASYLQHREWMGQRAARFALKKASDLDAWPFEESLCKAALELYQVGWEAYPDRESRNPLSPERLIQKGDRSQEDGRREESRKLATPTGRFVKAHELIDRLRAGLGHSSTGSKTVPGFDVWPEEKSELWHMTKDEYARYQTLADAEYEKRKAAKS